MNPLRQTLHIFKKDVRRYWAIVVLLTGVLAVDAVIQGGEPLYITGALGRVVGGLGFRGALFSLIAVLATALVVQEDDVSGRASFWGSKPISSGALLSAKLLFVGVFLLGIPLAFQALAITQVAPSVAIGSHLLQSALFQSAMLVVVAVGAAVTRDLKGTIFVGIGGYLILTGASMLLTPDDFGLVLGMRFQTAHIEEKVWWVGAGLGLVGLQYFTRRTRWVMATAAGAILVSAVISSQVPTRFFRPALDLLPAYGRLALEESRQPTIEVADVVYSPGILSARDGGLAGIDVVVRTSQNGLSFMPRTKSVKVMLHGENPTTLENAPVRPYVPVQRYVPHLDGFTWFGRGGKWAQFDVRVISAAPQLVAAAVESIESVEIQTQYDAYRPIVLGYLPIREGEAFDAGPTRARVSLVERTGDELKLVVTMSSVQSAFSRHAGVAYPRIDMILVNKERQQYLTATMGNTTGRSERLVIGGARADHQIMNATYEFGPISGSDDVLDLEWFEGASVMVYTREYAGSFVGSVVADASTWVVPDHPTSMVMRSGQ
jgi:hypothetical protein